MAPIDSIRNRAPGLVWRVSAEGARKSLNQGIIRPLQQRLPLTRAAKYVAGITIGLYLTRMPRECTPAFDLDCIDFRETASQIITAVPLKPSSRIRPKYPALFLPNAERLSTFDAKKIQIGIGKGADFGVFKPIWRKLIEAIVAIFSFKNPHFQHLFGRIIGIEVRWKARAGGGTQRVTITVLHGIVHFNYLP